MTDGYKIDKTEVLEKGITAFPSIYIEGAAACGKSTAVEMLLAKYPQVRTATLHMDREAGNPTVLEEKLGKLSGRSAQPVWIILEDMPRRLPEQTVRTVMDIVRNLPSDSRAILVGRDGPQPELLELLWKQEMELISQPELMLTKEEVRRLIEETGSRLAPEDVCRTTGGWAGCVSLMVRLSLQRGRGTDAAELRRSYEIDAYIRQNILYSLSPEEQEMVRRSGVCPWLNVELCREVWRIPQAEDTLDRLERKGLLQHDRRKGQWKLTSLLQPDLEREEPGPETWRHLGEWYETHGYIREALQCLRRFGRKEALQACMLTHYEQVPFLEVPYDEVMEWTENTPKMCYLRGIYCSVHQNRDGLNREIYRLEKMKGEDPLSCEIWLNLLYVEPEIDLENWLSLLEEHTTAQNPIRLYGILGGSCSSLCGIRDLTGLFACPRTEEKRRARLWQERLGEEEGQFYHLARMEYYQETERGDQIRDEALSLVRQAEEQETWQLRLAKLYLLCRIQAQHPDSELIDRIRDLEASLLQEESLLCRRNTEAVCSLYALWGTEPERLTHWLRRFGTVGTGEVEEVNYTELVCRTKGYVLLNQYDRAGKLLPRLVSYLQQRRRSRMLAETLFQQAIVCRAGGSRGQALRSAIESFLIGREYRYVMFYTGYGKHGLEVLEEYVDWMRKNIPSEWRRKKKYNYGNVLRMPVEDYLETVLRHSRKNLRSAPPEEDIREKLTLMEISVLQCIGAGMSNAQICEELNLKLSTVKSHVYSLYKKLQVSSRVQAILRGKELGLVK